MEPREKKKKQHISIPFRSTSQLLTVVREDMDTKPIIDVLIVDPLKTQKYNAVKTVQNLLLWFFTDRIHNPLWLTVRGQSKMERCIIMKMQMNSRMFERMKDGTMSFLNEKFEIKKKAQFREGSSGNWLQNLLSTEGRSQPAKIVNESMNCSTQQKILNRYNHFTLNEEQRKCNLYPQPNKTLTRDYVAFSEPMPQNMPFTNRILSIDCEMVTTERGFQLARITIVNYDFEVVYDSFCKPPRQIMNYNTQFSGLTEQTLKNVNKTVKDIQAQLCKFIFRDTILIGHSLENDLNAMEVIHEKVIDTAVLYQTNSFRKLALKHLAELYLKTSIQNGIHDSEEDAVTAMAIAKLKIQILSKIQKERKLELDVLKDVQKRASVVILSKNSPIQAEQSGATVDRTAGIEEMKCRLCYHLDKKPSESKIIVGQVDKVEEETEYYSMLDDLLKTIFEKSCPQTMMLLNFDPLQETEVRISPFCLFVCK